MSTLQTTNLKHPSSASNNIVLDSSARVGIGTTTAGHALQVNGAICATGAFGTASANTCTLDASSGRGRIIVSGPDTSTYSSLAFGRLYSDGSGYTEMGRWDPQGRFFVGTSTGSEKFTLADGNISLYTSSYSAGEVINKTITSYAKNGVYSNSYDKDAEICFGKVDGFDVDYTHGGFISFKTTSNNRDTAPTERFRISSTGAQSSVIPGGSTLYPQFGCRAWVNFNGTGTVAIRGSGNVSSITDNGTGDYTVNFTTAMPDANYSPSIFCSYYNTTLVSVNNRTPGNCIKASSTFRLTTTWTSATNGSATLEDLPEVSVAIFR